MTEDHCPRCGQPLYCGAAGPAPCACTAVQLDAVRLATLRQRYNHCLCLRCLVELSEAAASARPTGVGHGGSLLRLGQPDDADQCSE